jgi:hypothetical protein
MRNLSPWTIGEAWYDQRDLYTRSASIEADGYGVGPRMHPSDGSYHYQREPKPPAPLPTSASLYEREAWPWLNYKDPQDDRYFSFLHREHQGFWSRLRALFRRKPSAKVRPDRAIEADVRRALTRNPDMDATDIDVLTKQGSVTLEGTVADQRSKRLATHVALHVAGVRNVRNRLTVRHDDPTDANVAFVRSLALMGSFVGL